MRTAHYSAFERSTDSLNRDRLAGLESETGRRVGLYVVVIAIAALVMLATLGGVPSPQSADMDREVNRSVLGLDESQLRALDGHGKWIGYMR